MKTPAAPAKLRSHTKKAEPRKLAVKPDDSSMMGELYRRAENQLRQMRKQQLAGVKAFQSEPETETKPSRLLHELQVHQIELEMQNAELRKTRDDLEAALENYTDLYDFAPVGYITLTSGGTVQLVNLTGAHLAGVERARLVGRSFGMLITASQRPAFYDFLKQVFAGQDRLSSDFELSCPGLPARIVNIKIQRLLNGQECRAALVDITERKRVENQVRTSEIRYRRLFEAAHDGVLLLDPDTCKITDANPFMTKLLGYSRDWLIGKELFEIGLLTDQSASREMFRKLKRKHQVRYENLPMESQDGRHQEVEVVANFYQEESRSVIQCNVRDITERKRAEASQRRLAVLAASNRKLEAEIVRRRVVEESLQQSQQHLNRLLQQSQILQGQLREMSHEILYSQEEERKRISRELHDEITQAMVLINVQLQTLSRKVNGDPKRLDKEIARTQRLVAKSVAMVHDFARSLRPSALDDVGLTATLNAYMRDFMRQTGIRIDFTTFAGADKLNSVLSTVIFRVTQDALSNIARHAQASAVTVSLRMLTLAVHLEISDNGKAFDVDRKLHTRHNKRLGLIGMRERVEMVGGCFEIRSAPGQGTTIQAELPLIKGRQPTNGKSPSEMNLIRHQTGFPQRQEMIQPPSPGKTKARNL